MTSSTTTTTFSDFRYERPDFPALSKQFAASLQAFSSAQDLAAAEATLVTLYQLRADFQTMYNLAYIRHSADTRDAFYEAENNYFDEQLPVFESLKSNFYRALLASPFRGVLEQRHGQQLFAIAELSLKTFRPEIIENLQEENRLSSSYNKLKATAQIHFEGEIYNLSSILPREQDPDRKVRAAAAKAKWDWMAEQQHEIESIFDQLVKVRHQIARKLGFDNFIELGYARMLRTDYQAADVAFYREQIHQYIVPVAERLYARQARRLGLDSLQHYDETVLFPQGNAQPKGTPEWIVAQATQMYQELSPETDAFFRFMLEGELMDLVSRDGKATGGYCTFIPN